MAVGRIIMIIWCIQFEQGTTAITTTHILGSIGSTQHGIVQDPSGIAFKCGHLLRWQALSVVG